MNLRKKISQGISLIEILVVITIFAVLGVIVSSTLMLTIQGTKKSEAITRVKENLNYSLEVIERNVRNAYSVTDCTNTDPTKISYLDQFGKALSFSCVNTGGSDSYIASGSSRLTSDAIKIISCSFTCTEPADSSSPPIVAIDIVAGDALTSGIRTATISAQSKIYLRNGNRTSATGGTSTPPPTGFVAASGGVITTSGNYKIHTFTTSGTFTVTTGGTVEVLIVGGGGGGGSGGLVNSGGGAGGFLYTASQSVSAGNSYPVSVGTGGPVNTAGNNSSFAGLVGYGGGAGKAATSVGGNGASGGGGAVWNGYRIAGGTGSQGNNGGRAGAYTSPSYCGAGGGGAGAVGAVCDGWAAGAGGIGSSSSISGVSVCYAGGGGGQGRGGQNASGGGCGGGNGGSSAGTNGLGGGGGGSYAGGSGVVVIRYQYQ